MEVHFQVGRLGIDADDGTSTPVSMNQADAEGY